MTEHNTREDYRQAWRLCRDEYAALEAEVERLRAENGRLHVAFTEQRETLKHQRAEVERLREALRELASDEESYEPAVARMQERARAAPGQNPDSVHNQKRETRRLPRPLHLPRRHPHRHPPHRHRRHRPPLTQV